MAWVFFPENSPKVHLPQYAPVYPETQTQVNPGDAESVVPSLTQFAPFRHRYPYNEHAPVVDIIIFVILGFHLNRESLAGDWNGEKVKGACSR